MDITYGYAWISKDIFVDISLNIKLDILRISALDKWLGSIWMSLDIIRINILDILRISLVDISLGYIEISKDIIVVLFG